MQDLPQISVVIASYNRRATVGRAIASAREQSLAPLEIIVVDDGSSDGTAAWIAANQAEVRLIALPRNGGAAAARNAGIAAARGEIVAFLDSDDWWDAGYLAAAAGAFAGDPRACMAVSDVNMVLNYGTRAEYVQRCRPSEAYADMTENLLLDNFVTTMSCVCVRRNAAAAAGPLMESLRVVHDKEWYIRLSREGGVACTAQALAWRTIGEDNLVADLRPFLDDQFRFMEVFFGSPAGRPYAHLRWRTQARVLEGFASMAQGRGRPAAEARYLLGAFIATCREFRPRGVLLRRMLAAHRAALRSHASAVWRRMQFKLP